MLSEKERIEKIIENEKLTAKQFCEEVGIQQGTLSNIINGRNKPSLEVLQKILNRYRTIESDWLILGIGQMYRQNAESIQQTIFDLPPVNDSKNSGGTIMPREDYFGANENSSRNNRFSPQQVVLPQNQTQSQQRTIKKVVIFFNDDTFQEITVG